MADFISREAAIDRLNENLRRTNPGSIADACYSAAIDSIHLIPAADVVEVVKCRECRYRDPEDKKCDSGALERAGCDFPVDDDYYCADGKRKDGGQEPPKEEARHGRWEWDRRRESYRCSSCKQHNADRTAYCPNCGAVMDGGQDE